MNSYNHANIKFLSVIAYIGPLFVIGKFSYEKDCNQVKFHCKQGEVLFYIMATLVLVSIFLDFSFNFVLDSLSIICFLFNIGVGVSWMILSIMGATSALSSTKVRLPIVGAVLDKINNK